MNDNQNNERSSILYTSEFLGTILLSYSIGILTNEDQNKNQFMDAKIFLGTLTLILSICNMLGTADLNPAVSYLKFQIMKDKRKKLFLLFMLPNYIILQYFAAIIGFYIAFLMKNNFSIKISINPNISNSNGFFMETFASSVFYLLVAVLEHTPRLFNELFVKVYVTVFGVGTGIAMGSTTSGAGMNPAIVFGANFVRFLDTGKIEEFKYLWLYTLGPFIASYLVGNFYNKIFSNEKYYIQNEKSLDF